MFSFLFKNNTPEKNQDTRSKSEQQELSNLEKRIHEQLLNKNQLLLNNSSVDLGLQLKKFFELNQSNIKLIQQYETDIKNYQKQISYLQKQNSGLLEIVTDLFIQIHKFTKVFNLIKSTLSQYNIHFDDLSSFDKSFTNQIQSVKQKISQIELFQNFIDTPESQLQNQQKLNIQSLKDNILQIENSNSAPTQPSLVQTLPPNSNLDSKTKQPQLSSNQISNINPNPNLIQNQIPVTSTNSPQTLLQTQHSLSSDILDKLKIPINSDDIDNESPEQRQLRLKQYNIDFDSNRKAQLADILNTNNSQLRFPQNTLTDDKKFYDFLNNREEQQKQLQQQNEQLLKQQKNIQEQKQKQKIYDEQSLKKKQNLQNSKNQKQLSNLNKSLLQQDRSDYVQSLNQSKTQNLNQVLKGIQNKEKSNSNFSQQETQQALDQDQATYNKIESEYPTTPTKPKSFWQSWFP